MSELRGPVTQDVVRRQNLAAVVQHLHQHGATTRSALTSALGVNRSTIAALVGDLAARGIVAEEEAPRRPAAGRPSPVVRLRPDRVVALALELEVGSLSAAVVTLGGDVIAEKRVPHVRPAPPVAEAMRQAAAISRSLLELLPDVSVVAGVGVGVAGIVRRSDGLVHHAPNLDWRDVPLAAEVAAALRVDVPVYVGNDADLGAIAEHARGAGVGVDDLVFVSSEVGIGLGALSEGRLLLGADGYFGEFGHLPLFPRGRECRCGARGCWETEVGAPALLRAARRPEDAGVEGVRAVLADAARGDRPARRAVMQVAERVAVGLAIVVNALNPRLVVLGGFFGEMWPIACDRILGVLTRHALAVAVGSVRVTASTLGTDAVLIGAAEAALQPVLANPTLVPPLT